MISLHQVFLNKVVCFKINPLDEKLNASYDQKGEVMRTFCLKHLIIGFSILGGSTAFAQFPAFEQVASGHCSRMIKDPKCWEGKDNTQNPRTYSCEDKITKSCGTIESLHSDSSGGYYCKDFKKQVFDCTDLVQALGNNLMGLAVQITTPYIDACHIPGECGPSACIPLLGTASLNQSCQEN